MKKLIIFILIFGLIAVAGYTFLPSLIADLIEKQAEANTEATTAEIVDAGTPETFNRGDLSIVLPGDFRWESNTTIRNENYQIVLCNTPLSSITPNEGYDFPTLEMYMKECPYLHAEDIVVQHRDGIAFIDYETTTSNTSSIFKIPGGEGTQCLIGFQSENNFWIIAVSSATKDYAEVKEAAFEWAKTITFGEPQTTAEEK